MKSWWILASVSLTVLAGTVQAESTSVVHDIGKEARSVFALKCAACHGPDLVKPKGRFGYVLDLRRVAENPEMVIPFQPSESELWVLVQRDEMPPADSPHGPLSLAQKETIREWIAAGAPSPLPSLPAGGRGQDEGGASDSPPAPVSMNVDSLARLVRWLGRFHLLLLHFPIALVVAAGFGEARSIWQRNPLPAESVRFCLWGAALAAIPTAGLGWLFAAAGNGVSSPQLLTAHRVLGTTAAAWLALTAVCVERDARRHVRSRRVRLLLAAGILMTALTAHLGGLLAHGEDFFAY
jgi:uncharacterized membrane protein